MAKQNARQQLANLLRRMPWILSGLYRLWRILQTKYTAGVVGIIFNAQGEVLLVEHVFHPKTPWGLPGGWVDAGDSPTTAVKREFMEEVKLSIDVGQVILVEATHHRHIDIAFLCESDGTVGELSKELLDYGWFSLDNLPRLRQFHYRAIHQALDLKKCIEQ